MSEKNSASNVNRAKLYQLVLFPMNNGATNVYYILTLNFIAYYASGVLGLLVAFATTMVTVMRLFDAVTDPIIGTLIDKTATRFGKFRPYMVLGNVIMIASSILLYFGTRVIPEDMTMVKYVCFVLFYALYVIGYTFQTACTRSGQTCLTNDPNQRPLFTIFNTVSSLIGMELPGEGSIYMKQELTFLRPVYYGDTVRVEIAVIELQEEKKRAVLSTNCYNQKGEQVIAGSALVKPKEEQ